jgi:hypothetical protein
VSYITRSFYLDAPSGLGRYPRPDLLAPLMEELPEALQDTVRLGFLHSSRASGRIAQAYKAAADVRFVGVEAHGSTGCEVMFQLPRFGDAAPALYAQGKLWDDLPSADATAFDLFGAALKDVQHHRADSPRVDQPFLKRIGDFERVLKRGITRIGLAPTDGTTPHIDLEVTRQAKDLCRSTPPPRRVRVSGRLDLMGASQGVLKLHLRPGEVVSALWTGSEPIEAHRDFFNRDVIVEGLGIFRASGSLLRIEADAVAPASVQDDFFRQLPVAVPVGQDYTAAARLRPGEKSAYAALKGSVPAEESDEEFAAAVEELS